MREMFVFRNIFSKNRQKLPKFEILFGAQHINAFGRGVADISHYHKIVCIEVHKSRVLPYWSTYIMDLQPNTPIGSVTRRQPSYQVTNFECACGGGGGGACLGNSHFK